jgi:hypothetical protein
VLIVTSASTLFVNRNVGINLVVLFKISSRGGRNNGGGGRGRGRGQNYTGSANAVKRGLCNNLGTNVFEYVQNSAADQMGTSWENIVQYAGTNYEQEINNEFQNSIPVVLIKHVRTNDVLLINSVREVMIQTGQLNIQRARQAQETILKAKVLGGIDMDAPMKLAILQKEIAQG